jgi:hypothetical protein
MFLQWPQTGKHYEELSIVQQIAIGDNALTVCRRTHRTEHDAHGAGAGVSMELYLNADPEPLPCSAESVMVVLARLGIGTLLYDSETVREMSKA